jgi:hypothetical protein
MGQCHVHNGFRILGSGCFVVELGLSVGVFEANR